MRSSSSDNGEEQQDSNSAGGGGSSSSMIGIQANLEAPLLVRSAAAGGGSQAVRSPPRRAFFRFRDPNNRSNSDGVNDGDEGGENNETSNNNGRGRDENGGGDDDDDDSNIAATTNNDHEISLILLGRPYATQPSWWKSLPAVALLALLVSLAGLAFVVIVTLGRNLWLDLPVALSYLEGTNDADSNDDQDGSYDDEKPWKHWKWLAITTTGGFLAGLLSLFPGASPSSAETSFPTTALIRPIATLQERSAVGGGDGSSGCCCCVARILASGVALMTGAPLGPELAVTELAVTFASRLADLCGTGNTTRDIRNARTRAMWILSAIAAAWGGFLYGTGSVQGPMIVLELIVTTRHHAVTIDALIQEGRRTRRGDGRHQHSISSDCCSSNDYLETLSLQVVATTASVLFIQQMLDWINGSSSTFREDDDDGDYSYDYNFELWHVAAAILIGVACGLVGMFIHLTTILCSLLRASTSGPSRLGLPRTIHVLLFSALAGVLNGILIVACPNAAVDGFAFLRAALNVPPTNLAQVFSTNELAWMALTKAVSMSICIGFGLIGGSILPTVVIGACLGLVMSGWIGFLPISLTVPCCLAACPVSICPIPFSSVIAVILLIGTSAEQTTLIIIAAMSAWTITGGLGVLRRLSAIGNSSSRNSEFGEDAQSDSQELQEGRTLLTEDEILRSVRSSIFGGPEAS